jgi:hypothetical protein
MDTPKAAGNKFKFVLIALVLASCLHAFPAFGASPSGATVTSGSPLDHLQVLSDFDGDNKLDEATVLSNGVAKSIHIAFGKSSSSSLFFNSSVSERGSLVSGDIDDDGDIDLVWISQSAGRFVAWLGDGRGNFSDGVDPKPYYDRIRALFANAGPQWNHSGAGPEPGGVVLSTGFSVPVGFRHQPYLRPQSSLLPIDGPAIRPPCSVVLKLRGPPSRFS